MYHYKILKKERIILHRNPSTTRDLLTKWMLAHNITFQSEIELDSLETMKQILKYGNGVAFISKLAIEQEVQRNELCYIPIPEFEFQRNIYTIHHEDRWNSKIISFFTT
ncbi:LysR substrate-binding domain-containing protein [Bacillus pacificus]